MMIEDIQKAVAGHYGISVAELLGKGRDERVVRPRQVAAYIARKYTTESLPAIAAALGKTHASIVHFVKTVEEQAVTDEVLKEDIESIRKVLTMAKYVPERLSAFPLQELVRIFKPAGSARTIRVNGDPDRIAFELVSKKDETIINLWTR